MSAHLEERRATELGAGADASESEAEHLLACAHCRAATLRGPSLVPLLLDSWDRGTELRVEDRLLLALGRRRRSHLARVAVVLTGAAALAAAAILYFWPIKAPHSSFAMVWPEPGAELRFAQGGPDERQDLRGAASFRVRKLPSGARFRVRAGEDEVEVRGTRFRVVAGAVGVDALEVSEGTVELRTRCCGTSLLAAGSSWTRPVPSSGPPDAPPASSDARSPAAPSSSEPPAAPKGATSARPPLEGAAEPAFDLMQRGMAAFDAGSYAAASALLDRAVAGAPDAAWSRDARVLAGTARVMAAPVDAVASLGVGVASFDAASQRAARGGDARRALAARLGAARKSSGAARRSRFCALAQDPSTPNPIRAEADGECRR